MFYAGEEDEKPVEDLDIRREDIRTFRSLKRIVTKYIRSKLPRQPGLEGS